MALQTFKDWSMSSKQIKSAKFELEVGSTTIGVMLVTFANGGIYKYLGVPVTVWEKSLKTESIGKFINTDIKPHYEFKKLN